MIDAAILTAVDEELKAFLPLLKNIKTKVVDHVRFTLATLHDKSVVLINTGMGMSSSAIIATHVYHLFHPTAMFFSGTAGGVDQRLKIGDVVIGESTCDINFCESINKITSTPFAPAIIHPVNQEPHPTLLPADSKLLQLAKQIKPTAFKLLSGTLVSTHDFPAPKWLFEAIKNQHGMALEMEGSSLYYLGWLLKVPVLAVRGISNLINAKGEDPDAHNANLQSSCTHAAQVVAEIIRRLDGGRVQEE